jgi:hypothetical protein
MPPSPLSPPPPPPPPETEDSIPIKNSKKAFQLPLRSYCRILIILYLIHVSLVHSKKEGLRIQVSQRAFRVLGFRVYTNYRGKC